MALDLKKLTNSLKSEPVIRLYDAVDSTNNEAKRRAGTDSGICLYATMHQTAGRGRRGHSFYSPKDTGLYMTLSLPLSGSAADIQTITCAAAVAVCETIDRLSTKRAQIKWVNDILIGGKKVAGILTELVCDPDNRPLRVIIGIGLNLMTDDFPEEFAESAGSIGDVEPEALCAGICDLLTEYASDPGDPSVINKYKSRNLCIGKAVTYTKDGREHTAIAVDIDKSGGLIVEENGVRTALNSGEISVRL